VYTGWSELEHDDESQFVTLSASDTDSVAIELRPEAFSVNWTARTDSHDFINYCRALKDAHDGSSIIYNSQAQRHLQVSGKELLYDPWPVDDIRFIRLDLPSSIAVAWQQCIPNDPYIVGCAMSELDSPFIGDLFASTASETLVPLGGELYENLELFYSSFKGH
jgi:hypothetical protein